MQRIWICFLFAFLRTVSAHAISAGPVVVPLSRVEGLVGDLLKALSHVRGQAAVVGVARTLHIEHGRDMEAGGEVCTLKAGVILATFAAWQK